MRQEKFAVGHCRSAGERAELDTVREYSVDGAGERPSALDREDMTADTADLGAHAGEAEGEIGNLRLEGGIANGRRAAGQHRREQQILRRADRRHRQQNLGAVQAVPGSGMNHAALEFDRGAHGAKPGDMKIDTAQADRIAAGQGQPRFATTGEQRAEK